MRRSESVTALEKLGMVRLSRSFFMREFLYSETANFHGRQNIPDDPDLAIEVGSRLCEELLEPLNATSGQLGCSLLISLVRDKRILQRARLWLCQERGQLRGPYLGLKLTPFHGHLIVLQKES